jgi:hypothetical protein
MAVVSGTFYRAVGGAGEGVASNYGRNCHH